MRVFVLPFGVDCRVADDRSGLPALYRRYPVLRGAKVVLFLGRLDRIKGPEVLARGFARACRRHRDAVLLFAGPDYGAKAHVENVVRRAGLSNRVVFTGTIDGPTKAAALAAADVFALPSYSEGFSSSVLEPLAAGVPVVISEPCAFPRVADEVCRARSADRGTVGRERRRKFALRPRAPRGDGREGKSVGARVLVAQPGGPDGRPLSRRRGPAPHAGERGNGGG